MPTNKSSGPNNQLQILIQKSDLAKWCNVTFCNLPLELSTGSVFTIVTNMRIEATGLSEVLVIIWQITWHHKLDNDHLNFHYNRNFRCHCCEIGDAHRSHNQVVWNVTPSTLMWIYWHFFATSVNVYQSHNITVHRRWKPWSFTFISKYLICLFNTMAPKYCGKYMDQWKKTNYGEIDETMN